MLKPLDPYLGTEFVFPVVVSPDNDLWGTLASVGKPAMRLVDEKINEDDIVFDVDECEFVWHTPMEPGTVFAVSKTAELIIRW